MKNIVGMLEYRWNALEKRREQIEDMMIELEGFIHSKDSHNDIKSTRSYLILEHEINCIEEEKNFLERACQSSGQEI